MPLSLLNRRALLAGAGTAVASTALAVPLASAAQRLTADADLAKRLEPIEWPEDRVNMWEHPPLTADQRVAHHLSQLKLAMPKAGKGLPLAAELGELAALAMSEPGIPGRWEMAIVSGDAEQRVGFRQIDSLGTDPLVDAVANFRAGMDAFNHGPSTDDEEEEAARIEATYGPPLEVMKEWTQPAHTIEGVVEALRLAADENYQFSGSDVAQNMVLAALGYFDPDYQPA